MRQLPAEISLWTDKDLEWLSPFAQAELVAIGEAVHTSDGFYRAKIRMMRYFIEHHGFRSISFENPWGQALATTRFVESGEGDIHTALQGMFRVWRSTSVKDFLLWLREWNENHPEDKISLYGNDTQQPWWDLRFLTNSKILTEENKKDLMDVIFEIFGEEILEDGYHSSPKFTSFFESGLEDASEKIKHIQKIIGAILTPLDSLEYPALISLGAYVDYIYNEIEYRRTNKLEFSTGSFVARDKCMSKLTRHFHKGRKTLLWAHNHHIQRANANISEKPIFQGQFLFEELNENYKAIGLTAREIFIHWPGAASVRPPLITEASLEAEMMKNGKFTYAGKAEEFKLKNGNTYCGIYTNKKEKQEQVSDRFDALVVLPSSESITYATKFNGVSLA